MGYDNVDYVNNMFESIQRNSKFNQPLNGWDTSNISQMIALFRDANDFNQPLNSWDVSNVESFLICLEMQIHLINP